MMVIDLSSRARISGLHWLASLQLKCGWETTRMDGAENLRACSTQPLSCAACLVNPKAGLLTDSLDARPAAFPLPEATVACFAGELADHSGATVRDLHPLPFWLGLEHRGTNGEIVATPRKKRQEISPLTPSGCGRRGEKSYPRRDTKDHEDTRSETTRGIGTIPCSR